MSPSFIRTDRIKILVVISISLTAMATVITYLASNESKRRVDLALHSHAILRVSSEILSSVSRAESGIRAYMLTKDSTFLEPYHLAVATSPKLVNELIELVEKDRQSANQIENELKDYVDFKIEQLGIVAALSRDKGIDAAVQYSYERKDKLAINKLQSLINQFNDREEDKLKMRLAEVTYAINKQNMIRYISFLLIGTTLIFSFISITDKQKRNQELISELNETNTKLEHKVKERTHELDRKNHEMSELNAQLQQSVEEIQSFFEALQMKNEKTQAALLEVNDLYNNAPCGYHSVNARGEIIRINNTALKWLGYTRDEIIGKKLSDILLTPESAELHKRLFPELKKNGALTNIELEFKRKDKSIFPTVVNSTALYNSSNEFISSRTTVFDISRRKDLEVKLIKANDSLIQMNVEKDHFLGIAAHDLKSPLNSVMGLISLLKAESNLSASQEEYISIIEQSCMNMQHLIRNLLDINKIEQGRAALAPEFIRLDDLIKKVERTFEGAAKKKKIKFVVENLFAEGTLVADPEALNRILENLISNALKFSKPNTTIKLRLVKLNNEVRFEVSDQGPGISQEDMPKLFEKFQKLSARPTGGENSSGLGLSIVKELAELMRGKLSVVSEDGTGSTFILTLPA